MKICPKCGRSYDDETLNFCLEDGTVLNRPEAEQPQEPPPTVMIPSEAPLTGERPPIRTTPQTLETGAAQYTMPKKKSRGWIWALVILFVAVVVCGGGFAGLVFLGAISDSGDTVANTDTEGGDRDKGKADEDQAGKVVESDDMSDWPSVLSTFSDLDVTYSAGELYLNTRKNYFYVISTGARFKTADSSVSVHVRNPSGQPVTFGYGLVVNSDPSEVLKTDFAFVIRSDTRNYRVAQHENKKETVVVNWTYSDAIKQGTRSNILEVRSDGDEMKFFINGELVKTVTDYSDYRGGVAGLYTSDDVPIAFSKLELRR